MQFIANGPDVPLNVIKAHEAGELVLICGAGISVPAGLPLFKGLVEKVRDRLGAQFDDIEQEEFNKMNYDRVLGLLEREEQGRFSPAQVRHAVRKELTPPSNPDLETHKAILDLVRNRTGKLHLVTTNFDLLFEMADRMVRIDPAPLLPVPKPHKWDSLVYLHGRLDETNDPDGQHLVLTSSDFGVAYLMERWASRFVSELFRHFHVLFIGYSVEDPVMRYLMDALAAERRTGARFKEAYALTAYGGTRTEEEIRNQWEAKNIIPILYDDANYHVALHNTLREWAGIWRGGLDSKLIEESSKSRTIL